MNAKEIEDRIIEIPFRWYMGCYLLYRLGVLVYVGVSNDIAVRLRQHRLRNAKDWDGVKIIEENDYLNAVRIENYFITTYRPEYNIAGSKLEEAKFIYGDKYDEQKLAYPGGWQKPK